MEKQVTILTYVTFAARLTVDFNKTRRKKVAIARDLEESHRIDAINGLKVKSVDTRSLERKLRSTVKRYRKMRF